MPRPMKFKTDARKLINSGNSRLKKYIFEDRNRVAPGGSKSLQRSFGFNLTNYESLTHKDLVSLTSYDIDLHDKDNKYDADDGEYQGGIMESKEKNVEYEIDNEDHIESADYEIENEAENEDYAADYEIENELENEDYDADNENYETANDVFYDNASGDYYADSYEYAADEDSDTLSNEYDNNDETGAYDMTDNDSQTITVDYATHIEDYENYDSSEENTDDSYDHAGAWKSRDDYSDIKYDYYEIERTDFVKSEEMYED